MKLLCILIIPIFTYAISFEELKDSMIENSIEIKSKKNDFDIAKQELKLTKSNNFPILSLNSNIENSKSFSSKTGNINNQSISSSSNYNAYSSLSLEQNLIDFGKQNNKEEINKEEIEYSKNLICLQIKENTLKLLDLYNLIIEKQFENELFKKIILLNEDLYILKNKLYISDNLNKNELLEQDIKNQSLKTNVLKNNIELSSYFKNIYSLTGINLYDQYLEPISLLERNQKDMNFIDLEVIQNNINRKRKEISLLDKEYLPDISLYSKYDIYGYESDFNSAIDNMEPNSFRIGLIMKIELFNGFKTSLKKEKTSIELNKYVKEKDFKEKELLFELKNIDFEISLQEELYLKEQKILEYSFDLKRNKKRLFDIGEISKIELLESEIFFLEKELSYRKSFDKLKYLVLKEKIILGEPLCNHS